MSYRDNNDNERDRQAEGCKDQTAFKDGWNAAIEFERKRSEKLVKALEFYADDKQYQGSDIVDGVEVLEICDDAGEKAKRALEEYRDGR